MKRIDRAQQVVVEERVREQICKECGCRASREDDCKPVKKSDCKPAEVAVTVTSRKFVVSVPCHKISVSASKEDEVVRRVVQQFTIKRILAALKKRAELVGRKVDVRPQLNMGVGFVLEVPDYKIKVTGRSHRTLLEKVGKVLSRLDQPTT